MFCTNDAQKFSRDGNWQIDVFQGPGHVITSVYNSENVEPGPLVQIQNPVHYARCVLEARARNEVARKIGIFIKFIIENTYEQFLFSLHFSSYTIICYSQALKKGTFDMKREFFCLYFCHFSSFFSSI